MQGKPEPFVSSVASWLADAREVQTRLAAQAAKDVDHAYYRWLAEQLLEKLHGAQRALEAGAHTKSLNTEPLEGMLVLDFNVPIETDESFALSISAVMQRTAPAAIARLFADSELESTR